MEKILKTLNKHGEGLIVGGFNRDKVLGIEPKDCDFATNIPFRKLKEIFKNYQPKEIGAHFGVLQIKKGGEFYEIAKYRTEHNYKGRSPEKVNFVNSFYEDCKRRDFTINAIGFNGKDYIDYFGGIKDIKLKLIKAIGVADNRFKEDPLRMMRAIRFACRFSFKIERDTFEAIKNNNKLIYKISKERIRDEINKILVSDNPRKGFNLMREAGLLSIIIPELNEQYGFNQNNHYHNLSLYSHTMTVLENTKPILKNRLAALFHDIGKIPAHSVDEFGESHYYSHHRISADIATRIMKRLKYDNKIIETVSSLIYDHMNKSSKNTNKAIKRMINRVGEKNLNSLFDLLHADILGHKPPHNFSSLNNLIEKTEKILDSNQCKNRFELDINGNDVIELGFKEGEIVGDILKDCLNLVLENDRYNKKECLIEYILSKYKRGDKCD